MNKKIIGILSGLAAAAIWGGMYVVSKVVLDVIPPFSLIALRLILGGLALGIVVLLRPREPMSRLQFWQVFGVGAIGYGISLSFQFIGTRLSTAVNGSLVTSATPAFVLLFASVILRERITRRRIVALLVSSLGVVAVIDPRSVNIAPGLFLGNLSLLAAALTWALYSVLIRFVTRRLDVLTVSLIAFAGGLPIVLPGSLAEISSGSIGHITPAIVAGVLFLGIVCTALAMLLWNNSFALLDAGVASLTFFAQPIVGSLLGWLFLGEDITALALFGGLLIGSGIIVASSEVSA